MTDTVSEQVIGLIATNTRRRAETISPTSRLLHDLGIDADDAVDLFQDIERRFGTDFSALYAQWRSHFGPEGMPVSAGLVVMLSGAAGGFVALLLKDLLGGSFASLTGFGVAVALVASTWIANAKLSPLAPITVAELVHAVKAGAWPNPPEIHAHGG